jgi:hypothetical protein
VIAQHPSITLFSGEDSSDIISGEYPQAMQGCFGPGAFTNVTYFGNVPYEGIKHIQQASTVVFF